MSMRRLPVDSGTGGGTWPSFALVGAGLIDGRGGAPLASSTVIVNRGRIESVGSRRELRPKPDLPRIDLDGFTLMPGLIDCHVHFTGVGSAEPIDWITESNYLEAVRATSEARRVLEHGFTTVRSAGSRFDLALRRAVEEGSVSGPRIRACGLGLCRTRGHGDPVPRDRYTLPDRWSRRSLPWAQTCDGETEIRKAVRRLIGQNVDHVKFWATGGGFWSRDRMGDTHYTPGEMRVIVEEAGLCGLDVMCHVENMKAFRAVVDLGVHSIEHGDDQQGEELDRETCRKMVDGNVFLCPTLGINFAPPDLMPALPENVRRGYQRALEQGVKVVLGSDVYADRVTPYGEFNLGELGHLVDILELTPIQAITAATRLAAQACGLGDETGTVEPGKWADLLVLRKSPAANIDVLLDRDNIQYILKEGRFVWQRID